MNVELDGQRVKRAYAGTGKSWAVGYRRRQRVEATVPVVELRDEPAVPVDYGGSGKAWAEGYHPHPGADQRERQI